MKQIAPLLAIVLFIIVLGCMGEGGSLTGTTNGATNGSTNVTTTGGTTATTTDGSTDATSDGSTNGSTGGGPVTINIEMSGMVFSPQSVTAHAGDTIKWTNTEAMPHTVNSDTNEPGLNSFTEHPSGMGQGATFSWTVPATATVGTHFFYFCAFHGSAGNGTTMGNGMAGEITIN